MSGTLNVIYIYKKTSLNWFHAVTLDMAIKFIDGKRKERINVYLFLRRNENEIKCNAKKQRLIFRYVCVRLNLFFLMVPISIIMW